LKEKLASGRKLRSRKGSIAGTPAPTKEQFNQTNGLERIRPYETRSPEWN
jgi:hypothetical protein